MTLLYLGILSASVHWILARSHVMRWFWSRLRGWPDKLLRCPACSGFWIGCGLGAAGLTPVTFSHLEAVADPAAAGALAALLTPVFEAVMLWGLSYTSIESRDIEADDTAPAPTDPILPG